MNLSKETAIDIASRFYAPIAEAEWTIIDAKMTTTPMEINLFGSGKWLVSIKTAVTMAPDTVLIVIDDATGIPAFFPLI